MHFIHPGTQTHVIVESHDKSLMWDVEVTDYSNGFEVNSATLLNVGGRELHDDVMACLEHEFAAKVEVSAETAEKVRRELHERKYDRQRDL